MENPSDWLAMGGYGAYVWPSYILAAVVMIGLSLSSWLMLRRNEAELKALQQQAPGGRRRRRAAAPSDDSASAAS